MRFPSWCVLVLACAVARPACPWGDNGHIAVAKIADHFLTAQARAAIKELLPQNHIYDRSIAVFADAYKHTPAGEHTRAWHYVDIPLDATAYDPARDCRNDNCVVVQLPLQRAVLRDRTKPLAERQLALKLVVHFVGDVHQPLHCAERNHDAGGNEVAVRLRDQHGIRNLHSVWDNDLLDELLEGKDPEEWGAAQSAQIAPAERTASAAEMDPMQWALEGHTLAVDFAYAGVPEKSPSPASLNAKYITAAREVVARQLRKGGVRLAQALNADLK